MILIHSSASLFLGGPRFRLRLHSAGSRVRSDRGVGPSSGLLQERHQSEQPTLQRLVRKGIRHGLKRTDCVPANMWVGCVCSGTDSE